MTTLTAKTLRAHLLGSDLSQPFARADAPFRLLRLRGPDAGDFLQRLCSQDVLSLPAGQLRPAAFLDAKGKLLVTCLVFRDDASFWLEVGADQEERLAALLDRYHFTEKLAIERVPAGPCWEEVWYSGSSDDGTVRWHEAGPSLCFARRGVLFQRVHGASAVHAELVTDEGRKTPVSSRPLDADRAECLRMLTGLVRVGVETEANTLALEADLDDHCSTTKGCYTGQEIVARIHTYGHVNRKLCLLQLAAGERFAAPLPLHEPEDDVPVGRVLHAVPIPGLDARLGVGYLPKDFQALGTRLRLADRSEVVVIGYEPLTGSAAPLPA